MPPDVLRHGVYKNLTTITTTLGFQYFKLSRETLLKISAWFTSSSRALCKVQQYLRGRTGQDPARSVWFNLKCCF